MNALARLLSLIAVLLLIACRSTPPRPDPPTTTPIALTALIPSLITATPHRLPTPIPSLPRDNVLLGDGTITAFDLSPDGTLIAVGEGSEVAVYALPTFTELWRVNSQDSVLSLSFSPAGGLIAVGTEDGSIMVFDSLRGEQAIRPIDGCSIAASLITWSPNGALLKWACGGSLFTWDVLSKTLVSVAVTHSGLTSDVAWMNNGAYFVSVGQDGKIILHDQEGTARNRLIGEFKEAATSAIFSPDGTLLATGFESGRIILWDVVTYEPLLNLDGQRLGISDLAWSLDARWLISGGGDGRVIVWDMTEERSIHAEMQHAGTVIGVGITPDGLRVVSAWEDGNVQVWEVGE